MPFAQIPFVADGKLDVLGDEVDAVAQLDRLRFQARQQDAVWAGGQRT